MNLKLSAEPAHEAGSGGFGGEEEGAVAGECSGGEAATADGAFHGGGPAGCRPVSGDVEARPGGGLRRTEGVQPRGDGEGGARLLEHGGAEQGGVGGGGEEAYEFGQCGGENLLAREGKLRPGGTDDQL